MCFLVFLEDGLLIEDAIALAGALPPLLPVLRAWVNSQSEHILEIGTPLSDVGIRIARIVGVAHPERVRICVVPSLPLPDDPQLRDVALETGLLGEGMIGVTFGYGIYVCEGHVNHRLISHECRHVFQYETAGSIDAFLPTYLQQIVSFGYYDAPFEIDARAHEIDVA